MTEQRTVRAIFRENDLESLANAISATLDLLRGRVPVAGLPAHVPGVEIGMSQDSLVRVAKVYEIQTDTYKFFIDVLTDPLVRNATVETPDDGSIVSAA